MSMTPQFEDPKIQLILSIKQHDEEIIFYLKNNRFMEAGKSLYWLLSRLDITEKEEDTAIREIHNTLTLQNYTQMELNDFAYAMEILHQFLNRTYYKGFSNNRPPTRKSSIEDIGKALE